ncbi:hypothetical protein FPZ43_17310 [Mucilaginibacter pallidiroseus]|uniref:Uncharacterized protein n=1 Tax=Mucilaginibacter pallidiroseus TaxID=2599295 RepID=A0A563U0S6_9SPHI|nr:hypothetical protein [Mucilaginibacter pallidiroseus]TWR25228.1 hypothetical protein FPZ43_17310 [Mucilaginibacter pallidiroseus]
MSKKLLTLVYWLAVFCIFQSTQSIARQNVAHKTNVLQSSASFELIKNLLENDQGHICHKYNTFFKSVRIGVDIISTYSQLNILSKDRSPKSQLKGTSLIDLYGDVTNNPLRLTRHCRFAFTYQFLSSPCFLKLTQQLSFGLFTIPNIRIPVNGVDNADNKHTFNSKVILARTAG